MPTPLRVVPAGLSCRTYEISARREESELTSVVRVCFCVRLETSSGHKSVLVACDEVGNSGVHIMLGIHSYNLIISAYWVIVAALQI